MEQAGAAECPAGRGDRRQSRASAWHRPPEAGQCLPLTRVANVRLLKGHWPPTSLSAFQIVNGYFVHFFAPQGLPVVPKNVVFVIDVSGSMYGRKMEQVIPTAQVGVMGGREQHFKWTEPGFPAQENEKGTKHPPLCGWHRPATPLPAPCLSLSQTKDALLRILEDMSEEDYLNFILFSGHVTTWKDSLVRATPENIQEARAFVKSIKDQGSESKGLQRVPPARGADPVGQGPADPTGQRWELGIQADRGVSSLRSRETHSFCYQTTIPVLPRSQRTRPQRTLIFGLLLPSLPSEGAGGPRDLVQIAFAMRMCFHPPGTPSTTVLLPHLHE